MNKFLDFLKEHGWLFVSLVLVVFLAFFRYSNGIVQQDNYVGYAETLPDLVNKISFFDSRLFPGLPILIYLVRIAVSNFYIAGYLVTFFSFIASYFLLYKITGSKLSILPLVFPPILLNLASLINTEFPFIFLSLLAYWLIKNKKISLAFLVIGISICFRLAAVAVLAGVFVCLFQKKDLKNFFINLPYFAIPLVLLLIYNVHFFGPGNLFYQLTTYEALHPNRISIGVIQLAKDLIRAFRWHWYRILISGFCYITLFSVLFIKSIKLLSKHSLEFWVIAGIYAFTLIVNLVPFLENLGRYLAPTIPFFWIIFHKKLANPKLIYFLLPLSFFVVLV